MEKEVTGVRQGPRYHLLSPSMPEAYLCTSTILQLGRKRCSSISLHNLYRDSRAPMVCLKATMNFVLQVSEAGPCLSHLCVIELARETRKASSQSCEAKKISTLAHIIPALEAAVIMQRTSLATIPCISLIYLCQPQRCSRARLRQLH